MDDFDAPTPAAVSSPGNVDAAYAIAGGATILSDGIDHMVTIAQLKLNSTFEWNVVPKKDTRVYLKASDFHRVWLGLGREVINDTAMRLG